MAIYCEECGAEVDEDDCPNGCPREQKWSEVDWVDVLTVEGTDNGAAHCRRCGETQRFVLPMSVTVYCAALNAFERLHASCSPRENPKGD
jgi:hypothetical protein